MKETEAACHDGRMESPSPIGASSLWKAQGIGMILARTLIDYRRPVEYPDTIGDSALPG